MKNNKVPSLKDGQLLHFFALAILLGITWVLWVETGKAFPILFWLTISLPIAHQVFVWFTWRMELKSKMTSNSIGFKSYLIFFFLLLIGRPITLFSLAWANRNTLGWAIFPRVILSLVFLGLSIYTVYSVKRYFGFLRAAGADHFDVKYREMPLVKKGIFKYSNNGMYVFGFLMFWGVAFALDSKAALLASAFGHAYIWVHYFATEKPDMNYLYGD